MSLRRRMAVLKVLQDRPGLRLREKVIADLAGLTLISVELAALVEEGWVESEHVDGRPRVYWAATLQDGL
jgi:hypothetical protein